MFMLCLAIILHVHYLARGMMRMRTPSMTGNLTLTNLQQESKSLILMDRERQGCIS